MSSAFFGTISARCEIQVCAYVWIGGEREREGRKEASFLGNGLPRARVLIGRRRATPLLLRRYRLFFGEECKVSSRRQLMASSVYVYVNISDCTLTRGSERFSE